VKEELIMPPIRPELLDELLKDYRKPEDLLSRDGLLQQQTKAMVERALNGELTHHLGYEKQLSEGDNSGNSRKREFDVRNRLSR
jgi:transposase-like protein